MLKSLLTKLKDETVDRYTKARSSQTRGWSSQGTPKLLKELALKHGFQWGAEGNTGKLLDAIAEGFARIRPLGKPQAREMSAQCTEKITTQKNIDMQQIKWSIEQYDRLINDGYLRGKNCQLIEGNIVEMSPEGVEHFYTNKSLFRHLLIKFEELADIAQNPPIILDNSEPQPDIAVLRLPAQQYKYRKPVGGDVLLLIEISKSTLKFDLKEKLELYARNKIPEYWVVDIVNKKLIVHKTLKGLAYTDRLELTEGTICPTLFPNIEIKLDQVLLY